MKKNLKLVKKATRRLRLNVVRTGVRAGSLPNRTLRTARVVDDFAIV